MRPNKRSVDPFTQRSRQGTSVQLVVVDAFQEEEEGIGIASDIVKVEGKDPDTPVCLSGDRVRRYVGDFQS